MQLSCMVLKVQLLFRQCTLWNVKQQSSYDNLHGTTSRKVHLTDDCMVVSFMQSSHSELLKMPKDSFSCGQECANYGTFL